MKSYAQLFFFVLLTSVSSNLIAQDNSSGDWVNKGEELLLNGNYNAALDAFDKAVAQDEKNIYAWLGRAKAKTHLKLYESAYFDLDKCLKLRPQDATIYFERGKVLALQEKNLDAIMDYTKAIDIDPNMGMAYINRGRLYLKFKTTDKACSDFKKAAILKTTGASELVSANCR